MTLDQAEQLYYMTPRPREALREARGWLEDCGAPKSVYNGAALDVVRIVDRQYDGGYRGFLFDSLLMPMSEAIEYAREIGRA